MIADREELPARSKATAEQATTTADQNESTKT
jgi:hypothetical protein